MKSKNKIKNNLIKMMNIPNLGTAANNNETAVGAPS
jgi:hypothetical protein